MAAKKKTVDRDARERDAGHKRALERIVSSGGCGITGRKLGDPPPMDPLEKALLAIRKVDPPVDPMETPDPDAPSTPEEEAAHKRALERIVSSGDCGIMSWKEGDPPPMSPLDKALKALRDRSKRKKAKR